MTIEKEALVSIECELIDCEIISFRGTFQQDFINFIAISYVFSNHAFHVRFTFATNKSAVQA
jgi:hypothetical protein